ncbi:Uncharacterised protein [Bordetella pertussis]|nr:Uncharacterised protein [Bordetella pertussis]
MLVRLPVVVQTMAAFFSRKSLGVVPQSMVPLGMTPCLTDRSCQNCAASTTAGLSRYTWLPSSFMRMASLGVVSAWNSQ